eukprot:Gb_36987 [translate_table: standard]
MPQHSCLARNISRNNIKLNQNNWLRSNSSPGDFTTVNLVESRKNKQLKELSTSLDVLATYGMLLSRSWGAKLGGTIQLDMTYATVPVFEGEQIGAPINGQFLKHFIQISYRWQMYVQMKKLILMEVVKEQMLTPCPTHKAPDLQFLTPHKEASSPS